MSQTTPQPSAAGGPVAVQPPPYAEDIVPTEKASRPVVYGMAVAQFGVFLALLAPVTVSLALKVQSLVMGEQARAAALGLVLSVAAFMALVANPVIGRLSDSTTSRWVVAGPGWSVAAPSSSSAWRSSPWPTRFRSCSSAGCSASSAAT